MGPSESRNHSSSVYVRSLDCAAHQCFPIGGSYEITGLVSKPEHNGKLATLAEFSATTGRIRVSLEDGKGGVFEARVPRNPREADANVA